MPQRYSFIVKRPDEAKQRIESVAVEKIEGWILKRKKYVCAPIHVETVPVSNTEFGIVKVDLANPKEAGGFIADVIGLGVKGWLPQAEGESGPQEIQQWLMLARQNLGRLYIYDEAGDMSEEEAREILTDQGFIPKSVKQTTVQQNNQQSVQQVETQEVVSITSEEDKKPEEKSFMEKYGIYIIIGLMVIIIVLVVRR